MTFSATATSSEVPTNVTIVETYTNSEFIGINANIDVSVVIGNGSISGLEIVDSGFGFREGEEIIIYNTSNTEQVYVYAALGNHGIGSGVYIQKGGFLSDQKKLLDGFYYQDYSYEIRAPVTLDRYETMLKQLMHVAGTQYFGAFVYDSLDNGYMSVANSSVVQADDWDLNVSEIESATELGTPTVADGTGLVAAEIESNMELEAINITQNHELTATEIESDTNVEAPAITEF